MLRNLADAWSWISRINTRIDRLFSGAILENASVTNGRLRFIGGLLLIDNGGRLEVVGEVDGEGNFHWSGPWKFDSGDGEMAGNVTLSGDLEVRADGRIRVGEVLITPLGGGRIEVGSGIVIDGGSGRIHVQGGSSPLTLENGRASFGTGGALEADTSVGGARLAAGDAVVNVGTVASIRKGSSSVIVSPIGITINAAGGGNISLQGAVDLDASAIPLQSGTGLPPNVLLITAQGRLRRSDGT